MNSFVRIALVTAGIALGVQAVAHAQQPDSVFVISDGGKTVLRLNSDGGFVVLGEDSVGKIPIEGPGARLMWYPARGAFRAGSLHPVCCYSYWDDDMTGYGSVALGLYPIASGDASFGAGRFAKAFGAGSVALGTLSFTEGDSSISTAFGIVDKRAAVSIGLDGRARGPYSLFLGYHGQTLDRNATAIGPWTIVEGSYATAVGSRGNATGSHSIAIGWRAATNSKTGAIVLADRCPTSPNTSLQATAQHQFVVRACRGHKLYTDAALTTGVEVAPGGGSWSSISDVNRKENFEPLDGEEVLRQLREVPVMTWNYKTQDASIRHAGPTAQDFYAAFGLGESEQLINTVDIDGINMAAIKALEERTARQRERIEALEDEVDRQRRRIEEPEAELAEHRRRLEALEKRLERLERLESGKSGHTGQAGQAGVARGSGPSNR